VIELVIFDLDGTLVQTERLKAISYAKAAVDLCPYDLEEDKVVEAFKEVVGLSRKEVATALVERFELTGKAKARMAEFGVRTPWQAYAQVRLNFYERMLADPEVIRNNQWSHNITLLEETRRSDCRVGLATMSRCQQVVRILSILDLQDAFDFVATRDDVEKGKPDPEIYLLVAGELGIVPGNCLVVEDSPSGVQAALAAGMQVMAVSTPFTRQQLYAADLLPDELIVDDPDQVPIVAGRIIARHANR